MSARDRSQYDPIHRVQGVYGPADDAWHATMRRAVEYVHSKLRSPSTRPGPHNDGRLEPHGMSFREVLEYERVMMARR